MENVILKKENGKLIESKMVTLSGKKPYIVSKDKCLKNSIDSLKVESSSVKEVEKVRRAVYNILGELSRTNVKPIYSAMDDLKVATSRQELINIIKKLMNSFDCVMQSKIKEKKPYSKMDDIKTYGIFFKTINSSLSTNPDLVISITLKKLIATYYLDRILKLKKADINDLENLKLNNTSAEIMLEIIGEKYPKIAMTNGVYELSKKIFLDTIDIAFEQIQTHLCWEDCFNASADKCPKVRNKIKLSIDKYDFIQEGYQILNKKGEIDRFIVTKCDKYEKATPQAMTQAQKERIKKIKDGLRIAYFDAETIEEAYVIQNDLIKKGQIKNPRGRRPDDQQVQIMRLRRKKTNF